jgi:hypothetical protein
MVYLSKENLLDGLDVQYWMSNTSFLMGCMSKAPAVGRVVLSLLCEDLGLPAAALEESSCLEYIARRTALEKFLPKLKGCSGSVPVRC